MPDHVIEATIEGLGSGETTDIDLDPSTTVCSHHGEPFRETWPDGFTEFGLALFRALVNDSKFMAEHPSDTVQVAIQDRPLCELVNSFVLYQAYIQSGVGSMDECDVCGGTELGTPYTVQTPAGLSRYRHIGFNCVLTRLFPAN